MPSPMMSHVATYPASDCGVTGDLSSIQQVSALEAAIPNLEYWQFRNLEALFAVVDKRYLPFS